MFNIIDQPMRDTSTDYETGWIRHGMIYNTYADPAQNEYGSPGLGELGLDNFKQIPAKGQEHVKAALEDPGTRPAMEALLARPDAVTAIVEQFESDVMEAYKPTGKKDVVFKELAAHFGGKLKAAEDAIMEALPTKDTPEGRDAFDIVQLADDKQGALTQYYTLIGLEAMSPERFEEDFEGISGYDDEDDIMDDDEFGLGLSKKAKKWGKNIAIGVAVVGAVVLTAGVILPAIGAALPAIVGAVGTVGQSIFGGGPVARAPEPGEVPPERPTISQAEFNAKTRTIYELSKTDPAGAQAAKRDFVLEMLATGQYTAEAAANLVDQMMFQYRAAEPKAPPAERPPVDFDALADAALVVWRNRDTDPSAAAAAQQRMIDYLMNQGYDQSDAIDAVADALAQVAAQRGAPPSPAPTTTVTVTAPGVTPERPPVVRAAMGAELLIPLAIGAFLLIGGGGGRGPARRRPSRRRRYRRNSHRRGHRRAS